MAITQLNNYLPGQNLTNLSENVDYNRVGDDKTDITINHTTSPWTFTIKVGSLIEKDGNQYTVDTADYTLQATLNTHNYIVFTGSAFASSANRGTYDPAKGGFYDSGNRVLKYYIDPTADLEYTLVANDSRTEIISVGSTNDILLASGTWTAPFTQMYTFNFQAKGGDGGDATYTSFVTFGKGGGGGAFGKIKLYIIGGTTWTSTFSTTSGGNCTFSDGSTTLTVQNGYQENSVDTIPSTSSLGGQHPTGFDFGVRGTQAANIKFNNQDVTEGGNSFLGFGSPRTTGTGAGVDALDYGAGGSGAQSTSGTQTGGTGGPAVIIITG